MVQTTRGRSLLQRTLDRQWLKYLRLPPTSTDYSITRDIPILMRDRVILLGDNLEPTSAVNDSHALVPPRDWCRGYATATTRCLT
jgi:hypothetical protein